MQLQTLFKPGAFLLIIGLIALLAWLTQSEQEDPCADGQADISAAVLADDEGDQDALANRAIIMRGKCDRRSQ